MESHLLQMRGLKHTYDHAERDRTWSHLLQMRGLKPCSLYVGWIRALSHLLQMRGLKLFCALWNL